MLSYEEIKTVENFKSCNEEELDTIIETLYQFSLLAYEGFINSKIEKNEEN